jgi:uncharacterized protein involved in exopolysaccharide biosynthesis
MVGRVFRMIRGTRGRLSAIEARLAALEDSLEAAEAQIAERKAENVYLNRLLDMLQHGIAAQGKAVDGAPKP